MCPTNASLKPLAGDEIDAFGQPRQPPSARSSLAGGPQRLLKASQVLPRRWVVERTLALLNRNRHLAKHFETSSASAESWIMIASVKLLPRGLAGA